MKTKKGGIIGTTFTWFPATIITFIIIVLLIFASSVFLVGKIDASILSEGELEEYGKILHKSDLLQSIDYLLDLEQFETFKLKEGKIVFLKIYEKLKFAKQLNFDAYPKK
jgi:hypothetical protein